MRCPSGNVTVAVWRGASRRHRAQRGHQQQVRVRQARGWIPRHAEHRLAVDRAEHRRLAGLHGDAVEHDLALAADHVENQVALADRAAAGEHQHVARRSTHRSRRSSASIVSCAVANGIGDAAMLLDDGAQRELVDVVDLSRLQLAARIGDFIAGRKNRDAGLREHVNVADTQRGERADAARIQHLAAGDHDLSDDNVSALSADVLSRIDRRQHAHILAGASRFPRP